MLETCVWSLAQIRSLKLHFTLAQVGSLQFYFTWAQFRSLHTCAHRSGHFCFISHWHRSGHFTQAQIRSLHMGTCQVTSHGHMSGHFSLVHTGTGWVTSVLLHMGTGQVTLHRHQSGHFSFISHRHVRLLLINLAPAQVRPLCMGSGQAKSVSVHTGDAMQLHCTRKPQ